MSSRPEHLAVIDLGSNSFHLLVACPDQGGVRFIESLSEKVQLAAGLCVDRRITDDARERALACLGRYAEQLRDIPRDNLRIVGTSTLRTAVNAADFIVAAEQLMGREVEVVSGREEARLIYQGASRFLPADNRLRLVADIGGDSTELVIGRHHQALETASLHMGCVSFGHRFFPSGRIDEAGFHEAVAAARREVVSIAGPFFHTGWDLAVGASGTGRAIDQVCRSNGWSDGITTEGLRTIRRVLLEAGHVERVALPGLDADRAAIFPAGVAILSGIFEQLGLETMTFSRGALREGVLFELLQQRCGEKVPDHVVPTAPQQATVAPATESPSPTDRRRP